MFESQVGVRIANIAHEQMDRDETEIALVKLTCEISPLTPSLAGELHDFVKRTLYTSKDVEVNSLLGGATFALAVPPQSMVFRMVPDQKKASFTIDEAKIAGIKAKRSKKSTAWTLEFTATCSPQSEHQLAQLVDCYCKQRFVLFADADPNLFDTRGEEARKTRAAAREDDDEDQGEAGEPLPGLH